MLNVKNPGEWISLTQKIILDHFTLKNSRADFGAIKAKLASLCQTMARQAEIINVQHRTFLQNFHDIINYKFEVKVQELTENIKLMLRNSSYFLSGLNYYSLLFKVQL